MFIRGRAALGRVLIIGFVLLGARAWAKEVPYTLEDRDRLIRVEARLEAVDKRFEQIDKRFEQIDKRFEQIDRRFEDLVTFLWILAGIFTTLTGATIGFAIWDRRTMLRPVERRVRVLEEEKVDRVIGSLREVAQGNPEMAEALRRHGLL